jgi:hypothetical protein
MVFWNDDIVFHIEKEKNVDSKKHHSGVIIKNKSGIQK